jgi:hypothetical protein
MKMRLLSSVLPSNAKLRRDCQKLAEEQGVKPLDFDALRAKAGFWPEDESIDDFIAKIRKWRDEGGDVRELP